MHQSSLLPLITGALFLASCNADITDSLETTESVVYEVALQTDNIDMQAENHGEAAKPLRLCRLFDIRAHLIETYDADGDGLLSADERDTVPYVRPHMRDDNANQHQRRKHQRHKKHARKTIKRLLRLYDEDRSHELNAAEKAELDADLEIRCENIQTKRLADFDADADGELDEEEWTTLVTTFQERFTAKREAILAQYDTDEDGHLGRDERRALHQDKRQAHRSARQILKAEFDADADGELNAEEKVSLRTYLKEWVRGEHLGEEGGPPFLRH